MSERVETYQVDGRQVEFKLRRLKFGEYQKIVGTIGQVELINGTTRGRIDTTKLVDELMKATVSGEVDFHQLDVADGLDLQEKVLAFNGMGGIENFRTESK